MTAAAAAFVLTVLNNAGLRGVKAGETEAEKRQRKERMQEKAARSAPR